MTPSAGPGWDYLVPAHRGSAWDTHPVALPPDGMVWPNIGVYCPHELLPWLLGSFRLSAEVLDQRGEAYWGWHRDYLTGVGERIQLGRQSGNTGGHYLAGDERIDDRAAVTDPDELRSRVTLRCGACRTSAAFRLERVQDVLTALWAAGVREVSLDALARRVANAAKG